LEVLAEQVVRPKVCVRLRLNKKKGDSEMNRLFYFNEGSGSFSIRDRPAWGSAAASRNKFIPGFGNAPRTYS
jgi:hypothetical protein